MAIDTHLLDNFGLTNLYSAAHFANEENTSIISSI